MDGNCELDVSSVFPGIGGNLQAHFPEYSAPARDIISTFPRTPWTRVKMANTEGDALSRPYRYSRLTTLLPVWGILTLTYLPAPTKSPPAPFAVNGKSAASSTRRLHPANSVGPED